MSSQMRRFQQPCFGFGVTAIVASLIGAFSAAAADRTATPKSGNSATKSAVVVPGVNSAPTPAQQTKAPSPPAEDKELSTTTIEAKIKQLEAASDSAQPDRAALLEIYQHVLDDLGQAEADKKSAAEMSKERQAAPQALEKRKNDKKPAPSVEAIKLPAEATLAKWEDLLKTAEAELAAAQQSLATKQEDEQRRQSRALEIPQEIAAARLKMSESTDGDADAAIAGEESPAVIAAKNLARKSSRHALEAQIAKLDEENRIADSEVVELAKLDEEKQAREVGDLEKQISAWHDEIDARRSAEAEQQALEAHQAAAKTAPATRKLADENSELADQRQQLAKDMDELSDEREAVQGRLEKLIDEHKQVEEKVKAAGLTDAVGQMLRRQRIELNNLDADRRAVRARQAEISRVQLDLYQFSEQLDDLRDMDARVAEAAASLPPGSAVSPDDLRDLLKTKRKYLRSLADDESKYFNELVDLDTKQHALLREADKHRSYIDEHVLWIRSTLPISVSDARRTAEAAIAMARPTSWWQTLQALAGNVRSNIVVGLLALTVFIPWILLDRRLRSIVRKLGAPSQATERLEAGGKLRRALAAAAVSFLIAGLWPALVWSIGWLLVGGTAAHGGFPASVGMALQSTAGVILPLLLGYQIFRREGLAEAHFGWPAEALASLRRQVMWLIALGTPLVYLVTLAESQPNDAWKDSLGRMAFVAGQLLLVVAVLWAGRHSGGGLQKLLSLRHGSWMARLSYPFCIALAAIPFSLALLAGAGYYYTSLRLAGRMEATLWLVMGLVIGQALADRWLNAVYRSLAIKSAVRKAEASEDDDAAEIGPASDIDLEKIDAHTHRLLHSTTMLGLAIGLYFIWVDVLPALRFLNQVNLGAGSGITLANLLQAAIVAVMTIVAASNLPSLLEIVLLERLPLDNGVRYALSAVARYFIAIVGLALAGDSVGIGWPKMQWLAAAISFGLGFGLQEIFANFVSGLIVLCERPARIGDTVTVGDVTGVVSRIQMRATTIVDADRKELIVPNKEFITGRLVNWTLSDSVVRVVVRMGLAYGTDPRQAQRILMRIAAETTDVLKNPPPSAVLVGFSEKTLDFELRVFVGSVEALMPVRHRLNTSIEQAFRTSGIEFATPPRDVSTRTVAVAATSAPSRGQAA